MKKDILKYIKDIMKEYRSMKKDVLAELKAALAELEERRKESLAELKSLSNVSNVLEKKRISWERDLINDRYDEARKSATTRILDCHNDNDIFYLIYEDDTDATICAEEILMGEPFPKITHVAYASCSNVGERIDTEIGDLPWYSDERMKACNWDYEAEDKARDDYDTVIQVKYGTVWTQRYVQEYPDYVLPTDEEIANMINIAKETVSETEELNDTIIQKTAGTVNKEKVLERIDAMLTKAFVEKMKQIMEDAHIPHTVEESGKIPLPDKSRSPPSVLLR